MGKTGGDKALIIQLTYRRAEWKARCLLRHTGLGKLPSLPVRQAHNVLFASLPILGLFIVAWVPLLFFAKTPDQTIIKPSATIPNLLPLPRQGNKRLKEAEPDF